MSESYRRSSIHTNIDKLITYFQTKKIQRTVYPPKNMDQYDACRLMDIIAGDMGMMTSSLTKENGVYIFGFCGKYTNLKNNNEDIPAYIYLNTIVKDIHRLNEKNRLSFDNFCADALNYYLRVNKY